jgi:hypothetical protein
LDSACVRCQLRGLECGKKLPPQQRPRSITSVPNDYRRPVSLHIDTRMLAEHRGEDTPISAGSGQSALHSLPVSPFIFPRSTHLDPRSASATPLDGSPATFTLENFDNFETGAGFVYCMTWLTLE